jgi:mannosyl-3-phosphoglycerate phosphatase
MRPKEVMTQWIVFTDLDGTLLELETYAYDLAQPAVELLHAQQIPLVFCSSKTRAEQEFYRDKLRVDAPFIVENGSAVFIPEDYFDFTYPYHRSLDGYQVIELGRSVAEIRRSLTDIRAELGLSYWGYADLSLREIGRLTGLNENQARLACRREYSETLLKSNFTPKTLQQFHEALARRGLACISGSKFHTISGLRSDKGQAVRRLVNLFRRKLGPVITVGLGDSPNDAPFLALVDYAYLVRQPGRHWISVNLPHLKKVDGAGPAGWQSVIFKLFHYEHA